MIDLDALALDRRTGLPDALRVLLEAYPRDGWTADPGFDAMIRFWLDRHMMFRHLVAALASDAEAAVEGHMAPNTWAGRLARHGGLFVQELHTHHMVEDHHYFPVLKARDMRIANGFDLLDRDHNAIDPLLHGFAETANAALRRLDRGADAVAPVLAETGHIARLLDRHLTDEEDLVVPVILAYGSDGLG